MVRTLLFSILFIFVSMMVTAQVTDREWQARAVEKYPALGVPGSELNIRYVEAYRERQKVNPAFFADPKWPLILADELATPGQVPDKTVPSIPALNTTPTPTAPPTVGVTDVSSTTPSTTTIHSAPSATPPPSSGIADAPSATPATRMIRSAPSTPNPIIDLILSFPFQETVAYLFPAILATSLVGFLAVIAVVIWGSRTAAGQRRKSQQSTQTPNAATPYHEQTLWVGISSHWHYFWSWVWGILLLPVGIGLIIILGIVIDRARRVYIITGRNVILQYGILAKSTSEVRIKDIRSISVTRSGIAGMMGIGSVEFSSAASDRAEVIFANIAEADIVRDIIRDAQELIA